MHECTDPVSITRNNLTHGPNLLDNFLLGGDLTTKIQHFV